MYPKFIELHDASTGGKQFVNVGNIEGVFTEMVSEGIFVRHIDLTDGGCYQVRESYDDLKQLIKDCGCLIHKADPRLDTTTPLTMEDLAAMIGEPVWNANLLEWLLVTDHNKERDYAILTGWHNNIHTFYREDLMKYPLYRMKVNNGKISE